MAVLWILTAISLSVPVYSLDLDRTLTQFLHSSWTARDGSPVQIKALAQTRDGYLWIGSTGGLYSFDGVDFERFETRSGLALPSNNIMTLLAAPDGSLWIGFRNGGVSVWKGGELTSFGEADGLPAGGVRSLAMDEDGTVWAAAAGGLTRYDGARWQRIGAAWGYPGTSAQAVLVDAAGTRWAATENTIVFLPKGATAFQPTGEHIEQVLQLAESRDGSVWMAETTNSVRQVKLPGVDSRTLGPEVRVGSVGFLFDREGALWITSIGDGLRRVAYPERLRGHSIAEFGPEAESFTEKDGLTGDYAMAILEDREGNIWTGTAKGLDRFRARDVVPITFPSGYQDFGLAAGEAGEIWTGSSNRPVMRIRGGVPTSLAPFRSGGVTCVSTDGDGVVWMGGTGNLYRFQGDAYSLLSLPVGLKIFGISTILKDRAGVLWIYVDPEGVFRLENGIWSRYGRETDLPKVSPLTGYVDSEGRQWLGYAGDVVAMIDGDVIRTFSRDDGLAVGDAMAIQGRSGRVWVGGTQGLAVLDGDRFRTVAADGADGFVGISGIVEAADGDVWLNGSRGIARIPAEEVRRALEDPVHRVRFRRFDAEDGLAGTAQQHGPFPTAIEASDGRLWFSTSAGVFWVDPGRLSKDDTAPPVAIRSVEVDTERFLPSAGLLLPAGTTSLRIAYTALSLSIPTRVQFRYRLEGVDDDWHDAGPRREAFYNSLGPGTYVFRVAACNGDGVWNEEGATLAFVIAPTWFQTAWFRLLCMVAALFVVWSLYRMRMRQIAARLGALFDERLAERTRLARELHDTLLQTIQGSKMVADDALENSDPVVVRRAMERLSLWLGQAVDEGRAALNSLRTSTTEQNDLAEAFRRAAESCAADASITVRFAVTGESRDMHPIVRDEVYRIGYEAIRNACTHAKASRLGVELTYGRDLSVCVGDNGVGIEPSVAAAGKEGHFGLIGMRERASSIGANLTLASSATKGTTVTLVVPGEVAFRGSPSRE